MDSVEWAQELAHGLLADALPDRWAHTQGVAVQARSLAAMLGADAQLVKAAAWLHDIGYAPALAVVGFHPLDGARYLRDAIDASPAVCALVAHHSLATVEAGARGLLKVLLAEFPAPALDGRPLSALTYSDMTSGPAGESVTVDQRIAEILNRYPEHDVVHRSILAAAPEIRRQCSLWQKVLAGPGEGGDV